MPRNSDIQNGSEISKTRTPMVWLRRRRRERANASGWYPISRAVLRMCSFVFAATWRESGASFSTIETVDAENPLARATSRSVTWVDVVFRGATESASEGNWNSRDYYSIIAGNSRSKPESEPRGRYQSTGMQADFESHRLCSQDMKRRVGYQESSTLSIREEPPPHRRITQ